MSKYNFVFEIEQGLEKLADEILDDLSEIVMRRIEDRTKSLVLRDGGKADDLSSGYVIFKERFGRSPAVRDLFLTGDMWDGFEVLMQPLGRMITFTDEGSPSPLDKAKWNNDFNEWFGLNKSDEEALESHVLAMLK